MEETKILKLIDDNLRICSYLLEELDKDKANEFYEQTKKLLESLVKKDIETCNEKRCGEKNSKFDYFRNEINKIYT